MHLLWDANATISKEFVHCRAVRLLALKQVATSKEIEMKKNSSGDCTVKPLRSQGICRITLLGKFNSAQKQFDSLYLTMSSKMLAACGEDKKCKRDLRLFWEFVWKNKDKRNVRVLLVKFAVKTAVKRGCVTRLSKKFSGLTRQSTRDVAEDISSCAVSNWAA